MKKFMSTLLVLTLFATLSSMVISTAQEDEEVLYFHNWPDYIDPTLIDKFEEETGIKVVVDTIESNEEMVEKLQEGDTLYDVVVPSDYIIPTMLELDLLAELDHSQMTSLEHLQPAFANPFFDPGLAHCIPYFWGTTGIGFNWNDWEEAPNSWKYVFDPEYAAQFEGKIAVLDDMRETMGAALLYLGYSINTTDEEELSEAKEVILGIKPYLASFDSETYKESLLAGDISLTVGWSGDIFTVRAQDENLDFIIPEEGAARWTDNLCITADAGKEPERYARAIQWLDFLNRPDIAAINTNYNWYASPNVTAELWIDPAILEYEAIYPSNEVFEKLEVFEDPGEAIELYESIWAEIREQEEE